MEFNENNNANDFTGFPMKQGGMYKAHNNWEY